MKHTATKLSPAAVVGSTVIVMIALSWLIPFIRYRAIGDVDARVSMDVDGEHRDSAAQRKEMSDINRLAPIKSIWNGEVFRTEERIREAEAVALGASLYLAHEATINNRIPVTVDDLLAGIAKAKLLPPGVAMGEANQQGLLASERAIISVRYRPLPLTIEVFSMGRERLDGPAILVRVPDDGKREEGAAVYVASRLNDVPAPREFTMQAELIALGWRPEPARQSLLPEAERQKLMSWKSDTR